MRLKQFISMSGLLAGFVFLEMYAFSDILEVTQYISPILVPLSVCPAFWSNPNPGGNPAVHLLSPFT